MNQRLGVLRQAFFLGGTEKVRKKLSREFEHANGGLATSDAQIECCGFAELICSRCVCSSAAKNHAFAELADLIEHGLTYLGGKNGGQR
jgi:hypothetical protein